MLEQEKKCFKRNNEIRMNKLNLKVERSLFKTCRLTTSTKNYYIEDSTQLCGSRGNIMRQKVK